MKRYVDLKEISDGKLYDLDDMVKADCHSCQGCSACCCDMGASIILDPLDVCRMTAGLGCSFQTLLEEKIDLHVVDGIVLPNIRMTDQGAGKESCVFLSTEERCSIHPFRPGICRIFPLGRYYEDNAFRYFLQTQECRNANRSKVKVRKWVDTQDLKQYEQFITDWHYLLRDLEYLMERQEAMTKQISMHVLTQFYFMPYTKEADFYTQFYERYLNTRKAMGLQIKEI